MSKLLAARGLSKSYGAAAALHDASLSLAPGEFVVVLGASGSGKTTLFRCLTRLTEPDAGEIHVNGKAFHSLSGGALQQARREIGVVFQQFNLIRRRSAIANVLAGRLGAASCWRVASNVFSRDDIERARAALAAVGLERQTDQRADTLSGGQQQRVAIARALAQESRILLADEPVASLDPDTAAQVLELMRALCKSRGLAILCTLHQPHLAAKFADRVLEMNGGRIKGDSAARG